MKVKRLVIILITMTISYVLQMVALPAIPHLIAVPNLMLASVVSFGFLYGKAVGLATGVASGLLLDVLGSGTPGYFVLIFSVLGFLNGFLSEKMESEIILILFLIMTLNEIAYHAYIFVFSFIIGKSFSLVPYLTEGVLPELFMTLISFLLIYGVLLFFSKRWELKVNKGDVRIV